MSTDLDGPGVRDRQTVTAAGDSTLPVIDGVLTRSPIQHQDNRGTLFEIFSGPDEEFWREPIVHVYQTSVRPGHLKGWARHEKKIDRYCLAVGDLLMLLHDARPDSPTRGTTMRQVLSPRGVRMIRIPVGVWHLLINLGREEVEFVNFPTEPYHHDNPDRILLPWDSEEIPVDVRSYLPRF